jgi:hypothetical protein
LCLLQLVVNLLHFFNEQLELGVELISGIAISKVRQNGAILKRIIAAVVFFVHHFLLQLLVALVRVTALQDFGFLL